MRTNEAADWKDVACMRMNLNSLYSPVMIFWIFLLNENIIQQVFTLMMRNKFAAPQVCKIVYEGLQLYRLRGARQWWNVVLATLAAAEDFLPDSCFLSKPNRQWDSVAAPRVNAQKSLRKSSPILFSILRRLDCLLLWIDKDFPLSLSEIKWLLFLYRVCLFRFICETGAY